MQRLLLTSLVWLHPVLPPGCLWSMVIRSFLFPSITHLVPARRHPTPTFYLRWLNSLQSLSGDSIIRFVKLPGAITYCLSGGKIADFIELILDLLDIHPSVHTVIVHVGINWRHVEAILKTALCTGASDRHSWATSLRRRCVLSGPTPTMTSSSECFIHLFSLHLWMQNFTTATGLGFISNFDSFWTKWDLFKYDGLHPNRKGTRKPIYNFNFIAFSHNWWCPQQDPTQHPSSVCQSRVLDSAGPSGAGSGSGPGFTSLPISSIPVRITKGQCVRPKYIHSPHRNHLITVKTTFSIPAVESAQCKIPCK